MGHQLNHRLAVFTSLAALASTAVIGTMAYVVVSRILGDGLRAQALGTSAQLSMRVGTELKHVADRARFYHSTRQRAAFEQDGELIAVSLHEFKVSGDWEASQR